MSKKEWRFSEFVKLLHVLEGEETNFGYRDFNNLEINLL